MVGLCLQRTLGWRIRVNMLLVAVMVALVGRTTARFHDNLDKDCAFVPPSLRGRSHPPSYASPAISRLRPSHTSGSISARPSAAPRPGPDSVAPQAAPRQRAGVLATSTSGLQEPLGCVAERENESALLGRHKVSTEGRRQGEVKPAAAVRARARAAAAAVAAARAAAVAADEQSIYVPGGRGAGLREGLPPKKAKPPVLWSKPVTGNFNKLKGRFKVVLAGRGDLNDAGALCIKVFFGEPDSPWRAAQLRQLTGEQLTDLESRCNRRESVMFKAIDTRRDDAMVGFIEVSETSGSKYGMGSGVPLADTRPVVSNLAVDPRARRFGIGTALMDACEDLVKTWNFDEIILQVEEDNVDALAFYGGMGFDTLFVDRAARRYDTSGFLLQNVRTSKLTMRKVLSSSRGSTHPSKDTIGDHLAHIATFLARPFLMRPPPSSRRRAGPESVENLFGPPGGDARSSGTPRQVPPIRLHRTRR